MATVQTTVTTQMVHRQQHSPGRQYGVRACLLIASLALACQAFVDIFIGWRAHTVVTSSGGRPTGLAPDMTVPNILFVFGINLAIQAIYLAYTAIRPRAIRSKGKQGIAIVAILAYPVADMVKYTLFHHIHSTCGMCCCGRKRASASSPRGGPALYKSCAMPYNERLIVVLTHNNKR